MHFFVGLGDGVGVGEDVVGGGGGGALDVVLVGGGVECCVVGDDAGFVDVWLLGGGAAACDVVGPATGGGAYTGTFPGVEMTGALDVAVALVDAAGCEDVPSASGRPPTWSVGEPVVSTKLGAWFASLPVRVALAMTPTASTRIAEMPRVMMTTTLRCIRAPRPAISAAPVRDAAARCRVGGPSGSSSP